MQMEASDRSKSTDSIDVISLESKSSIQTASSKASILTQNLPYKENDSNIQDIERLNKLVKLNQYHHLKTSRSTSTSESRFPTDDNVYDTAADRLTSTLKSCFYKWILFRCFKIQLPSDD